MIVGLKLNIILTVSLIVHIVFATKKKMANKMFGNEKKQHLLVEYCDI